MPHGSLNPISRTIRALLHRLLRRLYVPISGLRNTQRPSIVKGN